MSDRKQVIIYTRGVSSVSGHGGFAAILVHGLHRKELLGSASAASNNRMDIQAAIEGLRALKAPSQVTLYNNNTYLVDAIAKGWALQWKAHDWRNSEGKVTHHSDLWQELLALCSRHTVSFVYQRLDGSIEEMTKCDRLAHEAAASSVQPSA